jgi:hypothetical protein
MENNQLPNPTLFRLVWGTVAIVAILSILIVIYAWWLQKQKLSDGIFALQSMDAAWMTGVDEQESGTSLGLQSNLRKAKVVIPARPHDPKEVPTPEMMDTFQRRTEFHITTNSNGIRVPHSKNNSSSVSEYTNKKGFRIVCMGASVTFGWGLPIEHSFPYLLQQQLNVEVINAGAPAGVPDGLVRWANRNLLLLEPDLVIFSLRPNYTLQNPIEHFAKDMKELQSLLKDTPLVVTLPPLSTFDFQIQSMERIYHGRDMANRDHQAISKAIAPIPVLELTNTFRTAQYNAKPKSDNETLVIFQRMPQNHKLISVPNQKTILDVAVSNNPSNIPDEPGLFDFLWADEPEQDLISPQLLEAFEANVNLREPLFIDGGHPDMDGHILYANTLAHWLQQNRLVP